MLRSREGIDYPAGDPGRLGSEFTGAAYPLERHHGIFTAIAKSRIDKREKMSTTGSTRILRPVASWSDTILPQLWLRSALWVCLRNCKLISYRRQIRVGKARCMKIHDPPGRDPKKNEVAATCV